MDHFKLHSKYQPTGDQPHAIEELVKGFEEGNQFQTLLGVTGSGKTFTMANVIQALNKPTLIISHNKTLAAQLYGEMKEFFPENAVEYFVSYYDYYQPKHMCRRRIPISQRTPQSMRRSITASFSDGGVGGAQGCDRGGIGFLYLWFRQSGRLSWHDGFPKTRDGEGQR